MIIGVGIDLADIGRIARTLTRFGKRFQARVFTPWERDFCQSRPYPERAFAMRFAAKEAFTKAIGLGMRGLAWREIEIRHHPTGQPYLILSGRAEAAARQRGVKHSHLSLSDEAGLAAAVVVLEGA